MKKNLSKKIIVSVLSAMLLSSTAISTPIFKGNVVFAAINDVTNPDSSTWSSASAIGTAITTDNFIMVPATDNNTALLFKVTKKATDSSTNGDIKFRGKIISSGFSGSGKADGTETKPFVGSITNGVVKVEDSSKTNHVNFNITAFEETETLKNITTLTSDEFKNLLVSKNISTPNIATIPAEKLSGVTFENLDLSDKTLPTTLDKAFKGVTFTGTLTLPTSYATITQGAFEGATLPAKLTLPNVTTIQQNAFKSVKTITELTLPKVTTATNINANAFGTTDDTENTLTLLVPSNQVNSVKNQVKDTNTKITVKAIPITNPSKTEWTSPTVIGPKIEVNKFIMVPNTDKSTALLFQVTKVAGSTSGDIKFKGKKNTSEISGSGTADGTADKPFVGSIANGVVKVQASDSISNENSVSFNITAFESTEALTNISSLTSDEFKSLLVSDTSDINLTTIPEGKLSGATFTDLDLTGKKLPSTLNKAFKGVTFTGTLTLPENYTTIPEGAFEEATLPAKLTLPNVTTIQQNAFKSVKTITELTLPKVTTGTNINANAFGATGDTEATRLTLLVPSAQVESVKNQVKNTNTNITVKAIPTATVSNKTITGNINGEIETAEITITLTAEKFEAMTVDTEVNSWITNLPTGLTAKIKTQVDANATKAVIKIEGTPTQKKEENLEITIPADKLKDISYPVTVKDNAECKFDISDISATVNAVTIDGKTGSSITQQDITITLTNGQFNDMTVDKEVNSWITNLPTGLTAKIKTAVQNNANTATIKIEGTPTEVKSEPLKIAIPKEQIKTTKKVVVAKKDECKFNITASASATVKNDVTISGTKNIPIDTKEITITLANEKFNAIDVDTDVSSWITNLPNGLTAKIKTAVVNEATEAVIKIEGTPTEEKNAKLEITIPADKLKGSSPVTVTSKEGCKFAVDKKIEVNNYVFEVNDVSKKTLTLLECKESVLARAAAASGDKFENGKLTLQNNKEVYTLTKLGDGTNPVKNATDEVLKSHLANVEEVSKNAFKANTNIKSIVLPAVKKIGANAFDGTTNLTNVDLGKNEVTIDKTAFNNKNANLVVKTENKATVESLKTAGIDKNKISISTNGNNSSSSSSSSGGGSSSNPQSGGGAFVGNNQKPNKEEVKEESKKEEVKKEEVKKEELKEEPKKEETTEQVVVVDENKLTLQKINLPSIKQQAQNFSDISSSFWAKQSIDKLSSASIITGSNGKFNPNGKTKRADVVVMITKLLGLTGNKTSSFIDVASNKYYANAIGLAQQYGIISGSNGRFNPENTISRQDAMVIISQILKQVGLANNVDTTVLNQFKDKNSISSYAKESVATLVNLKIISGNNGNINPKNEITRAEMAVIIDKLYNILQQAK